MSRQPKDGETSEEPIEIRTGDVQPLPGPEAGPARRWDHATTLPVDRSPRPPAGFETTEPLGVSTADALGGLPTLVTADLPSRLAAAGPPPDAAPTEVTADLPSRLAAAAPEHIENLPTQLFADLPSRSTGQNPLDWESNPGHGAPPPPALDQAFLCIVRGPGAGTSVALPEGEHVLGRSVDCLLSIGHPSIRRQHAVVLREGNRIQVRDAGGGGGTLVNGRRLSGQLEVGPGDQLALGESVLVLRSGPVTESDLPLPAEPPRRTSLWLGLAALATALASAALAAVLVGPTGERLFARAPAPAAPGPALAPPPPPPAPAPAPLAVVQAPELEADPELGELDLSFEPVAEPAPAAKPSPAPLTPLKLTPIRSPPRPARRTARAARPAQAAAKANPTASGTEALGLFNEGDLEGAIAAARESGSSSLATKMTSFQREVRAARSDASFGDVAGALRHYAAAAAIDDELTRGWSKPGGEVRGELVRLLIQTAEKALARERPAEARTLLEKALAHQPGNERAEELLERTRVRRPAAPAVIDPRSAADEAFGD